MVVWGYGRTHLPSQRTKIQAKWLNKPFKNSNNAPESQNKLKNHLFKRNGRSLPRQQGCAGLMWDVTIFLPSPAALKLWFLMTLTWPTDVAESLTELWTRPWPTSYHSAPHLTTPQETNHPSYVSDTSQYAKPDSGAYSTQDWARLMTEQPFNIITCIHTNFL